MVNIPTLKQQHWFISLGLPIAIMLSSFLITQTNNFNSNADILSNAILFDLLLTAPLVHYLIVRKRKSGKVSTIRIFLLGLMASGFILNSKNSVLLYYLNSFAYPVIELSMLVWLGRSFYLARKEAKNEHVNADFVSFTREILNKLIGNEKVSRFFTSEIVTIYYAFHFGKSVKPDYKKSYSVYKDNGILALLYIFLFILLVETFVSHLLLQL